MIGLVRLTPPGPAGVALLGLAGPGATALLQRRFRPRGRWPEPGRLAVGRLEDESGALLDEAVLARSGPDAYELSCHGGPGHLRGVIAALLAAGAVEVEAPLAGADPIRAAALAALPRATTELGAQVLLRQANGALAGALASARAALAAGDPARARRELLSLRAAARLGRALLEPARVALVGLPNAGKSSLLNALLGRERALVSPEPGTTRDLVEVEAELAGLPIVLVDAAGRREAQDELEAAGIERARRAAREAALRLVVIDGAAPSREAWELAAAQPAPAVVVINKIDLLADAAALLAEAARRALAPCLLCSARTGQGIDAIGPALREALVGQVDEAGPVPFTAEQEAEIEETLADL